MNLSKKRKSFKDFKLYWKLILEHILVFPVTAYVPISALASLFAFGITSSVVGNLIYL